MFLFNFNKNNIYFFAIQLFFIVFLIKVHLFFTFPPILISFFYVYKLYFPSTYILYIEKVIIEVILQTFKQPLSPAEEELFISKAKTGDITARNKLIEYNLRLVAHIVKKYHSSSRCTEDLISIGSIGLIKAIDSFDPNKGNRLVTYASRCIENEILMRLRQERKEQHEISLYDPIGTDKEGNEISLIDIICTEEKTILSNLIISDDLKALSKILPNILDNREQTIIFLRYGLLTTSELTQKEIASLLGISRSYVSRIEKKALLKLRNALNE